MRVVLGLTVVAISAFAVVAAEKPPADFQQAMRENGATLQKLAKDVEAKDFDAIAAGAAVLKKNFAGPVGTYWKNANNEGGLKMCTDAYVAADGLEKAAKSRDEASVAQSRKAVQSACGSCHTAHREQQPDKTYLIK